MTHHEWGWMVVIYLFLGGLGAGCLVLSGIAQLSGRRAYQRVARAGALLAPVLVAAGSGLLVFDLGNPLRFWRLFANLNPVSPMSVGSWLLMLFTLVASCYAVLHLPPEWLSALGPKWRRLARPAARLAEWNRPPDPAAALPRPDAIDGYELFPGSPRWVRRLRTALAATGIPLGIGVGIYTGVLLGAIPARPFWNTPMVAQLFLFSALSTSTALLLLVTPLLWRRPQWKWDVEQRALLRADLVFIFLELFIIIPYIVHGELSTLSARQALAMILGGPYSTVFWGGVVVLGIVVPMLLEGLQVAGLLRRTPTAIRRAAHYAAPTLILVGGYLIRWVFVHAGQDTRFL